MIFECHVSYLCNLSFIISPIYRVFAKYNRKNKIHRPFSKVFTVDEAKFFLKHFFIFNLFFNFILKIIHPDKYLQI